MAKQEKRYWMATYRVHNKLGFEKRGSRSHWATSKQKFKTWITKTVKAHYKTNRKIDVQVQILSTQILF